MVWQPPRKPQIRSQSGRFISKAEAMRIRQQEHAEARFESLQVAREELFWQAQQPDYLDYDSDETM